MKFQDIKNEKATYICDECKKEISSKDLLLEEIKNDSNMKSFTQPFIYVDKNDIIMSGYESPKKGDKSINCPHCNFSHVFGLTKKR